MTLAVEHRGVDTRQIDARPEQPFGLHRHVLRGERGPRQNNRRWQEDVTCHGRQGLAGAGTSVTTV